MFTYRYFKYFLGAWLILWSVCGCRDVYYVDKIDLCPGIEWWMVEYGLSEIQWGNRGIVAKGNLSITFCDDGINLLCGPGKYCI